MSKLLERYETVQNVR